ncbi:hypothetical protein LB823_02730 [Tsukamurella sp. M9C]|uniref:DUF7373 family lipoprotein n=1 Tax=Tsukamurella sp. M9C TaxID=2877520 RepID=UPI001CCED6CD|nr:hypothetical protein [Tsukamurella sp. M9C]MCA0155109.1 hypothetical protein [Tsukamurella sp. M9C]
MGTPDRGDFVKQESMRMLGALPLVSDIDPVYRYGGGGARDYAGDFDVRYRGELGSVPAGRVASAELVAEVRGSTAYWGAPGRPDVIGVILFRMPSEKAAADAVSPALLGRDAPSLGQESPDKVPVDIPGSPGIVAYSKTSAREGKDVFAFAAIRQFVLAVVGDFDADRIRKYTDAAAAALAGFTATPIDRLGTLAVDGYDLARLTLPPQSGGGMSDSARAILPVRYDVVGSKKYFDDAGVDAAGAGANVVYRARDRVGALGLAKAMVAEIRDNRPGVQSEGVRGAPGADCMSYTTGILTRTECVVPVGRYVAHYESSQKQLAVQAIGASYLILRDVG